MTVNMTAGKEWKTILLFSLPIMGSNLFQVLYHLADSLIVGNFVNSTALGAVGLVGSTLWLINAFTTGVGNGTSIVMAQYYGAGRHREIHRTVGASYTLALAMSAVITLLCLLLAKPLIRSFLGAPESMRDMSVLYFRIYAAAVVFQMFFNVTYGILRAHGDSRGGLYFLIAAVSLNIGLDLLFIAVFGWGVLGAAVATLIAQAVAAALSGVYLIRKFPRLRPYLSLNPQIVRMARIILRMAMPITARMAILSVGFSFMQRLINSFGPASIEGYTAMGRIEELAHIPSNSLNSAVSAFAGQNIGAGKPERAQRGLVSALKMGALITIVIAALVILFSHPMLGLFNIAGEAMRRGREHLILLMIFMIFSMTNNITSGFLQGAGDVRVPAVAGFVNLSIRLLSAYIMAETFIDFRSVYFSMPPAWATACLIVFMRYRSGKWKRYALA